LTRPGDATGDFIGRTFTAPAARSDRMREIVLGHVPRDRAIRVLDIGCGTGSLLFRLADLLPSAALVGIDISPANIQAANEHRAARATAARLQFEAADYLEYRAEPFDAIVTDGVLHLTPGDTTALVRKLAGDLREGGVLVCSMPFECAYNTMFAVVRRVLRAVRFPWLDRRILQIARLVHSRDMDDDSLRERVDYMYIPPERMMGEQLARSFASAGLHRATEYPMNSTSPSQLKHGVTIFVRGAATRR
jgi:trans-aconitate methyltransferase